MSPVYTAFAEQSCGLWILSLSSDQIPYQLSRKRRAFIPGITCRNYGTTLFRTDYTMRCSGTCTKKDTPNRHIPAGNRKRRARGELNAREVFYYTSLFSGPLISSDLTSRHIILLQSGYQDTEAMYRMTYAQPSALYPLSAVLADSSP